MNPLRLEMKRLLYSLWMLPAMLLVTAALTFAAYRGGEGREARACLGLLLGSVEYHVLLYAVIAAALVGVDVSARVPRLEILAGGSPYRFLRRKALLYVAAVLIWELVYLLVPLLLWRVPARELFGRYTAEGLSPPILRLLPARLFLDLGIALPFFLLQTALPTLQSMLVGDAAAAVLWIGLFDDHLSEWFQGIFLQPLPPRWFLLAAGSVALSLLLSFALFRLRERRE